MAIVCCGIVMWSSGVLLVVMKMKVRVNVECSMAKEEGESAKRSMSARHRSEDTPQWLLLLPVCRTHTNRTLAHDPCTPQSSRSLSVIS